MPTLALIINDITLYHHHLCQSQKNNNRLFFSTQQDATFIKLHITVYYTLSLPLSENSACHDSPLIKERPILKCFAHPFNELGSARPGKDRKKKLGNIFLQYPLWKQLITVIIQGQALKKISNIC